MVGIGTLRIFSCSTDNCNSLSAMPTTQLTPVKSNNIQSCLIPQEIQDVEGGPMPCPPLLNEYCYVILVFLNKIQ